MAITRKYLLRQDPLRQKGFRKPFKPLCKERKNQPFNKFRRTAFLAEEPEEDEDALAPDREVGDDDEEPDSDAERVEVASESETVMSPNRAVMSSRPSSFVSSPRTVSGSTSST